MNRCPSCRYLVPAGWSACKRCGAPIVHREPATVAAASPPAGRAPDVAPAAAVIPIRGVRAATAPPRPSPPPAAVSARGFAAPPPADTLVPQATAPLAPGRRADALVPRATSARSRTRARARPAVAAAAVVLTLAAGVAVRTWLGGRDAASKVDENIARAELALRAAAEGARPLLDLHGTYAVVKPAELTGRLYRLEAVPAATAARPGQVSFAPHGNDVLVLAAPAGSDRCVFARDEPAHGRIRFAVVPDVSCRAESAPARGWAEAPG